MKIDFSDLELLLFDSIPLACYKNQWFDLEGARAVPFPSPIVENNKKTQKVQFDRLRN